MTAEISPASIDPDKFDEIKRLAYDDLDEYIDPEMRTTSADKPHGNQVRTKTQREFDLAVVASMYLRGSTQAQICTWIAENRPYKVSAMQISWDMKEIRKRWLSSSLVDFDEAKSKELARIDELERAYWDGWEKSFTKKTITTAEKIDDTAPTKEGIRQAYSRTKAKKVEEDQLGDIRFLEGIQWCIDKRCKIFGLDAPTRVNINWRKEAEEAGIDPAELFNDLVGKYIDAVAEDAEHYPSDSELDGNSSPRSLAGGEEIIEG